MAKYFAEVFARPYGGGWAVAETPELALRRARGEVAESYRTERASYVLEFPDDAVVSSSSGLYGGWSASVSPLRVVKRHNVKATDDELLGRSGKPSGTRESTSV